MDKTTKPIRRRWNIFLLIGAFYWIILILTSLFVCSLSYEQKKSEILADVNIRLTQVGNAYQNLTEQFWESYLPIFENRTTSYLLLRDYFAVPDDDGLTPVELHDISNVLAQIVVRDDRIQWIAAYSPVRKVNYIYYAASQTGTGVGIMEALPDDFPYMEQMQQKNNLMEIYGEIESERSQLRNTIAVAGGTPALTRVFCCLAMESARSSSLRKKTCLWKVCNLRSSATKGGFCTIRARNTSNFQRKYFRPAAAYSRQIPENGMLWSIHSPHVAARFTTRSTGKNCF